LKVIVRLCLLLTMLGLFVSSPCNALEKSNDSIVLNFSTWHPHDSEEVELVWIPMLEELKRRSAGRIDYVLFDGEMLGSGPEHYDLVESGVSDMGYATLTWTPGRFPLSDVLSLPVNISGKDVAADIGNAVYERILYREFPDVLVLEVNGCIDSCLWTAKPVQTMEDVQGLRIRSPGGQQTNCIKSLGAEPVFMPMDQVYAAMENGSIDGIVTCLPIALDFEIYRVAPYATLATFGCVAEGLFMNSESWNETPDDLKSIIVEVCNNPYRLTGGLTSATYIEMLQELEDDGVEFYRLPPVEAERWYSRFQEITRLWANDLEAEGLPAREAAIIFNEECEDRGVQCVAFPPEWASQTS